LLYNTPAVLALNDGGLLIAHSSDHRQDRHVARAAGGGNASLNAGSDPVDNDIFLNSPHPAGVAPPAKLVGSKHPPEAQSLTSPTTAAERDAIARCRAQRITVNGADLRLLRGEFHRHTEISG